MLASIRRIPGSSQDPTTFSDWLRRSRYVPNRLTASSMPELGQDSGTEELRKSERTTYEDHFLRMWIVIACGLIGLLKGGIVSYGFTAFFEPLVNEFGWSYTEVSFAKSLRGMEMSLFAPIVGFLVIESVRKNYYCWGHYRGTGLGLLSITQSLTMFYVSFVFLAFGAGGVGGVVLITTVAEWFGKETGKALGVLTCLMAAGGLGHSLDRLAYRRFSVEDRPGDPRIGHMGSGNSSGPHRSRKNRTSCAPGKFSQGAQHSSPLRNPQPDGD